MAFFVLIVTSTSAVNLTIRYPFGNGVDSGSCANGETCFDRGPCSRMGCTLEDQYGGCLGDSCDAGQAYCIVDGSGRFRAYYQHLDRYCEMDGLDCSAEGKDCEGFGETIDGLGTSTATCGDSGLSSAVVCSTTMFSPPPPKYPASPAAPTAAECTRWCSAEACAAINFDVQGAAPGESVELGGKRTSVATVTEAIDLICVGADTYTGDSAWVSFLDSFRPFSGSPTHFVEYNSQPEFPGTGCTYQGCTSFKNICVFATTCESACDAAVCSDIKEGACIERDCPALLSSGCDDRCVRYLDPPESRRQLSSAGGGGLGRHLVGGFSFGPSPPEFVNARGMCHAASVRQILMIVGIVVAVVALLGTAVGVFACCRGWCRCTCCNCCGCDCGQKKAVASKQATLARAA